MKEGLEKYFEGGPVDVEKQGLPEVENENPQENGLPQEEQVVQQEQAQEQAEVVQEEQEVIEIGDTPVQEPALELVGENEDTSKSMDLPEGVEKLVEFINETGGTLQDYVKLNQDYSSYDEKKLLTEYYKQTKSHLDKEDIDYLVSKKLGDSEEEVSEEEYREKRIAVKEELSKAKAHLESNKDRYYADLKKVAPQQDPAELAKAEANANYFKAETEKVFEGFKGFEFSLGEGKPTVRYKVDNVENLKQKQSDLNNIIGGFLDEEGKLKDAQGYHKALFAMQNADKIAQLFYEQGKADAIKSKEAESKNIDFEPQKQPASSTSKLKPGQAREIQHPNATNKPGLNLRWHKG